MWKHVLNVLQKYWMMTVEPSFFLTKSCSDKMHASQKTQVKLLWAERYTLIIVGVSGHK